MWDHMARENRRSPTVSTAPVLADGTVPGAASPGAKVRTRAWVPASLVALAIAALCIDVPVARLMVRDHALKPLHAFLQSCEPFGQPAGVLFAVLAILLCDRGRRAALPRLLLSALGAGLSADLIKLLIARARPAHFDLAGSVSETFVGFLPGLGLGSKMQSFPSAHTATAVGFCFALSQQFPAGRPLFVAAAGLVALQRIECGAHFVTDTLCGAAVGYSLGLLLYDRRFLGGWFDRRESAARPGCVAEGDPAAPQAFPARVPSAATSGWQTSDIHSLSIVIPLLDEEQNLARLHSELTSVLAGLRWPYEIIFVDDGSRDGSPQELDRLAEADPRVTIVSLKENCGQAVALAAGIGIAEGDVVILLDADLQNDPADIPAMIDRLRAGCELVHGWRRDRRDRFLDRKLPSQAANRLISWVTGYALHDTGCTLKAMRRDVARSLPMFGGLHRFIPALAHARGARCVEMPAAHRSRRFGRSKYGLSRIARVLADLVLVKFISIAASRERLALQRVEKLATIRRGVGLSRSVDLPAARVA